MTTGPPGAQAKKIDEAARDYHAAVSYMETLRDAAGLWEEDDTVAKVEVLRIPLHLNLAACKLKLKDYGAAVLSCTKVGAAVLCAWATHPADTL